MSSDVTRPAIWSTRARRLAWVVLLAGAAIASMPQQQGPVTQGFLPRFTPPPTPPAITPPPTSTPTPTPTPNPPTSGKPILQASDFTYLGAIRMPEGSVDTTFAYGGMTGRTVNGRVRLFLYGNTLDGDQVYEIEEPGGGYSTNYEFAPRASLVTTWGDIYNGRRITWDAQGTTIKPNYLSPGDLYWNPTTQLLYWTYYDFYNVSHSPDWGLGATRLDDPATGRSTTFGPWRTTARDADNKTYYGAARCLYLFSNPLDGSMLCGSAGASGIASNAWGPDVYGGRPWPTASTPTGFGTPDLALPNRYLEHYFMGDPSSGDFVDATGRVHGRLRSFRRVLEQPVWEDYATLSHSGTTLRANPAFNGGVGSWTQSDATSAAIWLELNNKRGVIFNSFLVGSNVQTTTDCLNAAHEWYANAGVNPPSGACTHGCIPPDITGPVFTNAFPAFIVYDPSLLQLVANGLLADYSPEPNSVIDLERTYGIKTADINVIGAAKTVRGFYFDPVRKYLFILSARADDSRGVRESLIHVFAIRD